MITKKKIDKVRRGNVERGKAASAYQARYILPKTMGQVPGTETSLDKKRKPFRAKLTKTRRTEV